MRSLQELRVIVFLSFVATVYLLAGSLIVRMILAKLKIKPLADSRFQRWFRGIVITLAGIGLVCIFYGIFIEPNWLSIEHVEIRSAKIPANTRTIRIAHISDLHSDETARLETALPAAIAKEQPDLIVFTGDSINSQAGLLVFKDCLKQLAAIAPTYVVKGNHDVWYWYKQNLFGDTNAIELKGEPIHLEIAGVKFSISGIPVGSEERLKHAIDLPKEDFSIFLFHYPDLINEVSHQQIDLYCAGHTHGGQIALPFYGALVTFSKFDKQYEAGLYQVDQTHLYVNRGLGMEGGNMPRVRFCARPELTIIELKAGS